MDREKKRIWNLPEDSEEEELEEESESNPFGNENPVVASEAAKEKWGITEAELEGKNPEETEELEESEGFEGASLSELADSDEFREAWHDKHRQESGKYDSEEQKKIELADSFDRRGWNREAEKLREEVNGTEQEQLAEEIGKQVAKRLNDSSGQAEELESINQPEETEGVEDSAFVKVEHSDSDWSVFTDDEKAIEELEELSNREDSVSIISKGDFTLEARIHDTSVLPFNN